jgi:hypothetical protein
MSKEKVNRNSWGGKRAGAGRRPGTGKKVKICVSVSRTNWNTAVRCWKEKPSQLVDGLVSDYVKVFGSILEKEAAI